MRHRFSFLSPSGLGTLPRIPERIEFGDGICVHAAIGARFDSFSTSSRQSRVRPANPVGRHNMLHAAYDVPDLRLCQGRVKWQRDHPLVQV